MTSTSIPAIEQDRWAAWDAYLHASAGGFMQTSWWADFRVDAGYEHFGVILRHRGAIAGGALVLKFSAEGRRFYYVPDGPVLPPDPAEAEEVFAAILDAIEERRRADGNVSHLRIEPRWERLPDFVRGFHPVAGFADPYMEPRDTLWIDLQASDAELLAQMKPKGRYNIGVAYRHGVSVVEDDSDRGLTDFLDIYAETMERQGLEGKPADYFTRLMELLAPGRRGSLYFAECRGARLAAALVIRFGSRATYFFGGSRAVHRRVMAPYALHYGVMRRAREAGCRWYDFWGIAPGNAVDHPWRDITVFKRKFGGREINLVPTLDHVYDPAAYRAYAEAWR